MNRVKSLSTISCELVRTDYPITFRVRGVNSPVSAGILARLHALWLDLQLPATNGHYAIRPPSTHDEYTVQFLDPATFPKPETWPHP